MKFLLAAVNAKYIHSNPAVYSLRGYAGKELQPYIEIAEYTINQQKQEILADIYQRKPDVVGFSCYIWNWNLIQELLEELPKVLPDIELWLGGPEVSYHSRKLLQQYPQLAGIMIGEGEETFRELMLYYLAQEKNKENSKINNKKDSEKNNKESSKKTEQTNVREQTKAGEQTQQTDAKTQPALQKIAGLCLPEGYTGERAITDMSRIPFLYDDLTPFANKILYYETSRGCPYRCSYCLSSIEKAVRFRDISIVKKELQFFLDNRVKQVKFIDRTFNCKHEHAMEIWQYLYEHDNGITNFHFEISADILREDEIALLNKMRPGLVQLEIGVQSTNPKTIQAICRKMDVDKLEKIVAAVKRGRNIHQHLDLIAGLPYEDYESFGHSFDRVYKMEPEQLQLGFLKVLKGSMMEEKAAEYGIKYLERPPYEVLSTNWLPYGDVLRLKRIEEMVELYYNSNQFTHTLPFLEKAFDRPFTMFEKMAEFYQENGYFVNSPARVYRYQILLEFAVKYDPEREEIYKELLVYDLYLRENLKSRPAFAKDLTPYKEPVKAFYRETDKQRNLTHLEPFWYPVWDKEALQRGEKNEKESLVLFDYEHRSPLTYEAAVERRIAL